MKLELLKPAEGSVRNNVRLGRGQGSGGGGTAKRGHKGAKSRSGYSRKLGFEGGQMPLQRRVPKFGFNNINRVEYKAINLDTIQELVDKLNISVVSIAALKEHGLIGKSDLVKVLGRGELKSKLSVSAHAFSQSAIDAIVKLGGSTTVTPSYGSGETIEEAVAEAPKVAKAKVVKEVVALEVVEEVTVVTTESVEKADDLRKIEGIGPKIAEIFVAKGIDTFQKLADSKVEDLSSILEEAGSSFASHNPATWPEQAALAAAGNWDELKALQEKLDGGRPE